MVKIKLILGIFCMVFINFVFASNPTPLLINLGNVRVNHSLEHPVQASLSLQGLPNVMFASWNVACDYKINETGGASDPSPSDPFVGFIQLNTTGRITGTGYTGSGFIAPNGKLKISGIESVSDIDAITFISYDTSGDLLVSNCIATIAM